MDWNEIFKKLAQHSGGNYDNLEEWWQVLKIAYSTGNGVLISIALRNISTECFYSVADISNMSINQVVEEAINTFIGKNATYSKGTLANFYRVENDFDIDAFTGLLTRMSDKMSRISTLTFSDRDDLTEPLRDSYMDLGVYAIIAQLINIEEANRAIKGFKYAEAEISVDDPSLDEGDIDEYRRHL
jgi:hypothetical protein